MVTPPTVASEKSPVLLAFNFVDVTLRQISVEACPCHCAELENSLVSQWAPSMFATWKLLFSYTPLRQGNLLQLFSSGREILARNVVTPTTADKE